jgi:hypothetical protein
MFPLTEDDGEVERSGDRQALVDEMARKSSDKGARLGSKGEQGGILLVSLARAMRPPRCLPLPAQRRQ